MNNFCIVGAGISGITLAKKVGDSVIVEKSRGVGGRIAARRLGSYSLNHGPEEIHPAITDPHSWIKNEAETLNIHKSWEVSHLEPLVDKIKVVSNQGQVIECRKIILTIPAPQAQSILERSQLNADFLAPVRYKRVIQFMLLFDSTTKTEGLDAYAEKKRLKQLTENLFMALYEIRAPFLEDLFDREKEEIKYFCLSRIINNVLDCHVHKWRYSEVITSIDPKFQTILQDKNIFLAGDYFGNHGIETSLQSVRNISF